MKGEGLESGGGLRGTIAIHWPSKENGQIKKFFATKRRQWEGSAGGGGVSTPLQHRHTQTPRYSPHFEKIKWQLSFGAAVFLFLLFAIFQEHTHSELLHSRLPKDQ